MRLAGFAKGAEFERTAPLTAIVTFTETGGSTITIPAPEKNVGRGRRGGTACAEQQATPSSSGAQGGIEDKGPNPSDATLAPAGGGDSGATAAIQGRASDASLSAQPSA